MDKHLYQSYRFGIVVVRNSFNKYLCVEENQNKGWWVPGGSVHQNQTFIEAAIRQCREQTLIEPVIKGIIRVDYGKYYTQNCLRCIFYAEPKHPSQIPKSIADNQSKQAQYLTLEEIVKLKQKWRSPDIYLFPKYLEEGGIINPLSSFKQNFNDQFDSFV